MANSRSRTKHGRLRYGPKSHSRTYARFGTIGPVEKGAVVKFYMSGGWHKGIVVRLLPVDDIARAYGRRAIVEYYDKGRVHEHTVGVGDMQILGYAKRLPNTHSVTDAYGFKHTRVTRRADRRKRSRARSRR